MLIAESCESPVCAPPAGNGRRPNAYSELGPSRISRPNQYLRGVVSVRIRRTRDRNHRSEFGITNPATASNAQIFRLPEEYDRMNATDRHTAKPPNRQHEDTWPMNPPAPMPQGTRFTGESPASSGCAPGFPRPPQQRFIDSSANNGCPCNSFLSIFCFWNSPAKPCALLSTVSHHKSRAHTIPNGSQQHDHHSHAARCFHTAAARPLFRFAATIKPRHHGYPNALYCLCPHPACRTPAQ